jgi:hypothetical protein
VNLALVGKAVTVSEAIARGDSGLLPRIKVMMGNLKLDEVSEQVVQHVETIGREVEKSVREHKDDIAKAHPKNWWPEPKTPQERRSKLFEHGFGSLFGGIAMMIILYVVSRNVAFNIPPDVLAKVPFDLYALISLAWLFGLLPALTGLGQVAAAFMIRGTSSPAPAPEAPPAEPRPYAPPFLDPTSAEELRDPPPSVTEHTTRELEHEAAPRPDRRSSRA